MSNSSEKDCPKPPRIVKTAEECKAAFVAYITAEISRLLEEERQAGSASLGDCV